jgi:hypothetical protein
MPCIYQAGTFTKLFLLDTTLKQQLYIKCTPYKVFLERFRYSERQTVPTEPSYSLTATGQFS